MRRFCWSKVLSWSVCGLLTTACVAAPPPDSSASAPSVKVFADAQHAAPIRCSDEYFHYLPGMVDYCLGLHDWQKERYRNSIEFFELAAVYGSKGAEYALGLIYYNGHQVPANRALGLAWLELANERHDDAQAAMALRSAIKLATSAQRQHARRLFKSMLGQYGDKVAAKRAWVHFMHQAELVQYEMMGGGGASQVCVPGKECTSVVSSDKCAMWAGKHCVFFGYVDDNAWRLAAAYFHGWQGNVTVGQIQQVPASPAFAH